MIRRLMLQTVCAMALLGAAAVHAADTYVLKFATLAPQGSTWMKAFDAWGKELAAKSQGRFTVKFYPGGISGDEPDMLRKIRFGQLQGAALSGHGVGEIFPPARILETPFLFDSHAEIEPPCAPQSSLPSTRDSMPTNTNCLPGWKWAIFIFSPPSP